MLTGCEAPVPAGDITIIALKKRKNKLHLSQY
jgi:hypothetical protein